MKKKRQSKLIKFLLFSEIFFFFGKYLIKFSNNKKNFHDLIMDQNSPNSVIGNSENEIIQKDLGKNIINYFEERKKHTKKNFEEIYNSIFFDSNSVFYRSNITDLVINIFFIKYLGKYLNIICPKSFKAIIIGATLCNISCLYANEKIKSNIMEKTEIKNFNIFKETSFITKIMISYTYLAFFEKILENRSIGYDIFKLNRKPIFFLLNLFIFAKITNFISLYTCDTIK